MALLATRPPEASPRSYSLTVRGLRYLWGSAGLLRNVTLTKPVNLFIANDSAGDPVTIGTQVSGGAKTAVGVLQPGEQLTLSVDGVSGIYAECAADSVVHCQFH